jgi:hypothetical protein
MAFWHPVMDEKQMLRTFRSRADSVGVTSRNCCKKGVKENETFYSLVGAAPAARAFWPATVA